MPLNLYFNMFVGASLPYTLHCSLEDMLGSDSRQHSLRARGVALEMQNPLHIVAGARKEVHNALIEQLPHSHPSLREEIGSQRTGALSFKDFMAKASPLRNICLDDGPI